MEFYTAQQVADKTGMGVDWLWRQARDKKIPHHKLGGRYRWTESDLEALAEQSAVTPSEPVGREALIPLGRSRRGQ